MLMVFQECLPSYPQIKQLSKAQLFHVIHISIGYNVLHWIQIELREYTTEEFEKQQSFPPFSLTTFRKDEGILKILSVERYY